MRRLYLFCICLLTLGACENHEPEHSAEQKKDTSAVVKDTQLSRPDVLVRDTSPLTLVPVKIAVPDGPSYSLNIPKGFNITYVAHGFKRPRFLSYSPDHRLFLTDLYTLADNDKGKIIILDDFDSTLMGFRKRYTYLDHLHNPNSVAFYTDAQKKQWLYIALTQALIRIPYKNGDTVPSGKADTLARFPDWGQPVKLGGWHLTRTVSIHKDKVYVSVGSSCNACIEKEEERAGFLVMNPDGSGKQSLAQGIRNAVGLDWVNDSLYATAMGVDHLGNDEPDELVYKIEAGKNYGWPYYYEYHGHIKEDPQFQNATGKPAKAEIPYAVARMDAHSAPLGICWFGAGNGPELQGYFLIALHGSGAVKLGRGYKIIRAYPGCRQAEDFITGFLHDDQRDGRPCGILPAGKDAFFFTDDFSGVVFYVYKS